MTTASRNSLGASSGGSMESKKSVLVDLWSWFGIVCRLFILFIWGGEFISTCIHTYVCIRTHIVCGIIGPLLPTRNLVQIRKAETKYESGKTIQTYNCVLTCFMSCQIYNKQKRYAALFYKKIGDILTSDKIPYID